MASCAEPARSGLPESPAVPPGRYAPAVTAGDAQLPDMEVTRELAAALRAGDDSAAAGLATRAGVPRWLLTDRELGPRGRLDISDGCEALGCISALAAGPPGHP